MRLITLRVTDFAAIVTADVQLGRGLNVLYGPNDLGKSTLADSIRLGLLLPHASTASAEFVPWTGGQHPQVEVTFESEAQRIWRVRKIFGKSGSSTLFESRNGVDFDEIAHGRQVDAKLREILRWGIPEPGGSGGGKGLPASFLATTLLSTQADVTAVLKESLAGDPTQSGRDRIATALQAVAQDPLFQVLLRRTQQRRDEAYTEKGAPKQGKDSPFKKAAERLKELRKERDDLQAQVDDSRGVELLIHQLTEQRMRLDERVSVAAEDLRTVERLAAEASERAAAFQRVVSAQENVRRIEKLDGDVVAAEQALAGLTHRKAEADDALAAARRRKEDADRGVEAALAAAATASQAADGETVSRPALELRRVKAANAGLEAGQRRDAALAAQEAVEAVDRAQREQAECSVGVQRAIVADADAADQEAAAAAEVAGAEALESALAIRTAENRLAEAETVVAKEAALRMRLAAVAGERRVFEDRRAAIIVPAAPDLAGIRRLDAELAAARAALDVGILVTVTPRRTIALRSTTDGVVADIGSTTVPVDIEARTSIDLEIADVATIAVRGGRRDAQERVRRLEQRWTSEAAPHLAAAGAAGVEELDARFHQAAQLDADLGLRRGEMQSLEEQIGSLQNPADAREQALAEVNRLRAVAGDLPLDRLVSELDALGPNGADVLRRRKESATTALATIRKAGRDRSERKVAEERLRQATAKVDELVAARDRLLVAFPEGAAAALAAGREALQAAKQEEAQVGLALTDLEQAAAAEQARIDAVHAGLRAAAQAANTALEAADQEFRTISNDCSSRSGGLEELRRLRQAEDLDAATAALREATERHASLPAPARTVTAADVDAAREMVRRLDLELTRIGGEIQKAHGALEQVGGGVARERLRDVTEAYEEAERHEREIEAEFAAWKLLLEQMKAAEAAQASNLGQVLGPAIATRFEALTEKRYEGVRLTAALATEGILVRGTVRPADRMSVGTREQLSTLYRLSLAEYLRSAVVLDDQLVQSDENRMDWFRDLLVDKSHTFQIVVFTCRPDDYLSSERVPADGPVFMDHGLVRAIDLERAIHRR